jgi:hypothetical protein
MWVYVPLVQLSIGLVHLGLGVACIAVPKLSVARSSAMETAIPVIVHGLLCLWAFTVFVCHPKGIFSLWMYRQLACAAIVFDCICIVNKADIAQGMVSAVTKEVNNTLLNSLWSTWDPVFELPFLIHAGGTFMSLFPAWVERVTAQRQHALDVEQRRIESSKVIRVRPVDD